MRKPPHSKFEHLDIGALSDEEFEARLFEPPRIGDPAPIGRPSRPGSPPQGPPPRIGDPHITAEDDAPAAPDTPDVERPRGLRARLAAARAAIGADPERDIPDDDPADDPADTGDHLAPPALSTPAAPSLGAGLSDDNAGRRLGFSLRVGLRERLRLRKAAATSAQGPSDDDPFASLVTPLSGYDLDQLRRELEQDTVPLYERVHAARRGEGRSLRAGIITGWVVVLALALVWRDFFAALADQTPPAWLRTPSWAVDLPMAADYPQVAMYALGALAPFFLLLLANSAGTEAMRMITRPSVRATVSFMTLAIIATVGVMLVVSVAVLAAVATLAFGNIVAWVIGPRGPSSRGVHGSPRR